MGVAAVVGSGGCSGADGDAGEGRAGRLAVPSADRNATAHLLRGGLESPPLRRGCRCLGFGATARGFVVVVVVTAVVVVFVDDVWLKEFCLGGCFLFRF